MTRFGFYSNETVTFVTETRNLPIEPFKPKDSLSVGKDWQQWLEEIEGEFRYFRLETLADKTEALLIFGGREIAHLGKYLPDPDTRDCKDPTQNELDGYQKLRVKLCEYFIPRQNKYLARYLFLKMRPRARERTVAYATRLREQANECEFGDNCEERLLEHLIMTVENQELIRKCIRKEWTLLKFLRKADEEENISLQISFMRYMSPKYVQKVSRERLPYKGRQNFQQSCRNTEDISKRCDYCGLAGVQIKGSGCPAYRKR